MARNVNVAFLVCSIILQNIQDTILADDSSLNLVSIYQVPEVLRQCDELLIEFKCTKNKQIGIEIIVQSESSKSRKKRIFSKSWHCQSTQGHMVMKTLAIHLVDSAAFRPDCLNRLIIQSPEATVRSWIIETGTWDKWGVESYDHTSIRTAMTVRLESPYGRKSKGSTLCFPWYLEYYYKSTACDQVMCKAEQVNVELMNQPAVFTSSHHGVHRQLREYRHKRTKQARLQTLYNPVFTLNIWFYIIDFCVGGHDLCSIVQKVTWDDLLPTPLLLVTGEGRIHVQLETAPKVDMALLTPFLIPRYKWCQMIFSVKAARWSLSLDCQGQTMESTYYDSPKNLFYNDIYGLYVVGGTELIPAFKGYVGLVELYRGQFLTWTSIEKPPPDHPMFNLGDYGSIDQRCRRPIRWVDNQILRYRALKEKIDRAKFCLYNWRTVFGTEKHVLITLRQCSILQMPIAKKYRPLRLIIRRMVFSNQQINYPYLADILYQNATFIVEKGNYRRLNRLVSILDSASCYGNHDATYLMATILNYGLGVAKNEKLAFNLLLKAALDRHRLSMLALGSKHFYGLDGLQPDPGQAYLYYKGVADLTQRDRDIHRDTDVYVESVYLTDEKKIEEQTDENGDTFLWLKHQAKQGVTSAQHNLARLMFWGQQGVKRDLKEAAKLYKRSAESGKDPTAQLDYGIVLMKGQGITQDVDEGLRHLELAAAKGNSDAMSALGAYYLDQRKDNAKALENFEKSYKLGNVDAAHNIGHMYQTGRVPDSPLDRVKAYEFFAWAANKNQVESGIMVAMYNMRGHPSAQPTSPEFAAIWARFIAEKNPAIGTLLRNGLTAYRNGKWSVSLLHYLMAAHAGVQVGQFNVAQICEQNPGGISSYIRKECVWSNYNLTIQRQPQFWNTFSLIKMGDCYWYECPAHRNVSTSAELYSEAAVRGDPQGYYSLALLVEDGIYIRDVIWKKLKIPKQKTQDRYELLKDLYTKCQQFQGSESYGPCGISFIRINLEEFWNEYKLLIQISFTMGFLIATALFVFALYRHLVSHPSFAIGV